MSMSSFLGDLPQTVGERDRRFRSFGPREDTDIPIGTAEPVNSPLAFAFNSIAELTVVTFDSCLEVAAPAVGIAQGNGGQA
jgi:hypothetical protein